MNICKQMWTKGYIVGHTVTHYSFHREFFLYWGRFQGWRMGMREEGDKWDWGALYEVH